MPCGTTLDNSCIVNGTVYFDYFEYTPDTDMWVILPIPTHNHGLVSLNGKLTVVGGQLDESNEYSRVIRVLDSDTKQWTEPYPPMIMGRECPACASYQHYLIVAGGTLEGQLQSTASVEILDTRTGQWFKAPPMMYNGSSIRSVIIGQTLYVLFSVRGAFTNSKSLLRV